MTSPPGNHALALRLENTFVKLGWRCAFHARSVFWWTSSDMATPRCSLFDVHEQELATELVRRADADNIVAFVGIHLLRAGWYVASKRITCAEYLERYKQ